MALRVWDGSTSGDYGTDTNWFGDTVPSMNDSVSFGAVSRKVVSVASTFLVQGWTVNDIGYTFNIAAGKSIFFFGPGISGAGATNAVMNLASGSVASFLNSAGADAMTYKGAGRINFSNSSSAGTAVLDTDGLIEFSDQASADHAKFSPSAASEIRFTDLSTAADGFFIGVGLVRFTDHSTAANSSFNSSVRVVFEGTSSAGDARILPADSVTFQDNATASAARIQASHVRFEDDASAADAVVDCFGTVDLLDNATAGDATITAFTLTFKGKSDGGNASVDVSTTINMDDTAGQNGDHRVSLGALKGAANLVLGTNELTIGSAEISSRFSGSILGTATGGSIVKVGTGLLVLTGASNYLGGTFVKGGTLEVDGSINGVTVVSSGAALTGKGTVGGVVTVKSGGLVAPGRDAALFQGQAKSALMVGGLNFDAAASAHFDIGGTTADTQYDTIIVTGKVAVGGAELVVSLVDGFVPSLTARQSFVLIDNNGKDAVKGHFIDLSESTSFAMGNRIYSITYKGGTGNDVVLTSEGALIVGTAAADTISKSKAPAGQLTATVLNDKVLGLGGKDKIKTGEGSDTVQGGKGKDSIDGGKGSDTADYSDKSKSVSVTLDGSHNVTVKVDGKAEDTVKNVEHLVGGSATDRFTGDSKANRFDGGLGKDIFKGAGGKDQFVFSVAPGKANADAIADFKHKTDKIALDDTIFTAIGTTLNKAEFYAKAGARAAHDDDDRIIYNKTNGNLYYDADGEGGTKAVLFATLTNHTGSLSISDFLIV